MGGITVTQAQLLGMSDLRRVQWAEGVTRVILPQIRTLHHTEPLRPSPSPYLVSP